VQPAAVARSVGRCTVVQRQRVPSGKVTVIASGCSYLAPALAASASAPAAWTTQALGTAGQKQDFNTRCADGRCDGADAARRSAGAGRRRSGPVRARRGEEVRDLGRPSPTASDLGRDRQVRRAALGLIRHDARTCWRRGDDL